jgi:phosphatidyl-myo-inositol alpha-mannosyltransferase
VDISGRRQRHVAALARELRQTGDEVSVLSPWDPPDRLSRVLHRRLADGASPPERLTCLGRTLAVPANGAVSNLCLSPGGVLRMRRELRSGRFDVIHVHEPIAPLIGWLLPFIEGTPVAAAWSGRRWFGGRYRTIPNGVDLSLAPPGPKPESEAFRIVLVGRSDERKGLPVLLAAFAALVRHVPARLTVVGGTVPLRTPRWTPDHVYGRAAKGRSNSSNRRS